MNPDTGLPYPEDCAKFNWPDYFFTVALSTAVYIPVVELIRHTSLR